MTVGDEIADPLLVNFQDRAKFEGPLGAADE
jgi:hypothetical protein